MHLNGVKPNKVTDKDGNVKKIIYNTVSFYCRKEEEGMSYMADFLKSNEGVTVTKYTFCNVIK